MQGGGGEEKGSGVTTIHFLGWVPKKIFHPELKHYDFLPLTSLTFSFHICTLHIQSLHKAVGGSIARRHSYNVPPYLFFLPYQSMSSRKPNRRFNANLARPCKMRSPFTNGMTSLRHKPCAPLSVSNAISTECGASCFVSHQRFPFTSLLRGALHRATAADAEERREGTALQGGGRVSAPVCVREAFRTTAGTGAAG